MPQVPGSLRAEAARRGVSLYRVRLERGELAGYTKGVSVGKPRRGENLLSVDKATPVECAPIPRDWGCERPTALRRADSPLARAAAAW